jgi:6-phosphofructokinase 1
MRFLLEGGSEAMVTIQEGRFVPIRFQDLIEPSTGKIRVRYVDVRSDAYQALAAYMIRLTSQDLDDPAQVRALAHAGGLSEAALVERFTPLVRCGGGQTALDSGEHPATPGGTS